MEQTKKPNVTLTGVDGNAFSLLAACTRAGRRAGMSKERLDEFRTKAMSGDYDNLLITCMEYFDVD
jgi:hypothetical protein